MSSSTWDKPARAQDGLQADATSASAAGSSSSGAEKAAAARKNRDKIRCLDGLRGIACLLVFNYHFLWPWTPSIMLGYGAMPPGSPEPYTRWWTLPIVCLLHRGRPMVAIFFAISGYVICRHIIRAIHEKRLHDAYQSLASAVFRRVFRLYIPPTISMFIVAMLAQMGAFRSEKSIYKGPDSVYINGTVTVAQLNATCVNGTFPVKGPSAISKYLGLESPMYLGNATNWTSTACLNDTSQLFGPSSLYTVADTIKVQLSNTTANTTQKLALYAYRKSNEDLHRVQFHGPVPVTVPKTNATKSMNNTLGYAWIQLGGSWEEHPFIHDNMTYALKNFTRAYAEWANPFNFGHYHPRYDPHTFTIPMELRGSMFIYLFLLGTAAIKPRWRLRIGGFLSAYSLTLGRWDMATFLGGALLSEMDIRGESDGPSNLAPPVTSGRGRQPLHPRSPRGATLLRRVMFVVALYFLSYPDAAAEFTPGFSFLASLVPKYYIPLSGWMFYQAMGALMLLHCVLRSPFMRRVLEGPTAQHLGKISFSLYLVHGPVLHSLGFWIMPRLFDHFGQPVGFAIGYVVLLAVTMYLTGLWYRKIDTWSTTVGRRIEKALLD